MTAPVSAAGPQLDAAVAEALGAAERIVVYRWADRKAKREPLVGFLNANGLSYPSRLMQSSYASYVSAAGERMGRGVYFPAAVSTDIAAAWLVVEKMFALGWLGEFRVTFDGFLAEFDNLSSTHRATVDPRDGGMPLAICRAALSAVASLSPPLAARADRGGTMIAQSCVASGPPSLPAFVCSFLGLLALCLTPVWLPLLIEYFSPLARAERMRERELARRAAELVALGVAPFDAKARASADMRREATDVLTAMRGIASDA